MHMIAYISDYVSSDVGTSTDLRDIEISAKINNAKVAIKGVLFFRDGQFLQVIEGLESDLRDLMGVIEKDPRHENIEYLVDTPITSLSFSDWNMDVFHLDGKSMFDRETLRVLSEKFTDKLLPRSDSFLAYYKGLIKEQERLGHI